MLLLLLLLFSFLITAASSLAARPILVTGANRGQGLALCRRVLVEHDDTFVFLCARSNGTAGRAVVEESLPVNVQDRVQVLQLDVTNQTSMDAAVAQVQDCLQALQGGNDKNNNGLYAVVSNAGILWDYPLQQQFAVNAVGPCRLMQAFLPILQQRKGGRCIVVSSGLGPLMHSYAAAHRQAALQSDTLTFADLESMMQECLQADHHDDNQQASSLAAIGFPGGPFEHDVPDFHKYGLAKMMTDAYMLRMAKQYPNLSLYSCDPGLVYTDLILRMPRYAGQSLAETGAKTPDQGVEVAMRLLFTNNDDDDSNLTSGGFYAMNKAQTALLQSTIDVMPRG